MVRITDLGSVLMSVDAENRSLQAVFFSFPLFDMSYIIDLKKINNNITLIWMMYLLDMYCSPLLQ